MPMVGAITARGDFVGESLVHAFDDDGEGAGLIGRARFGEHLLALLLDAALGA